MKTGKTSKIDRITHILEGRKDSKFEHDGHAGGLTNKEKLRKKNFVMVRKGKKSVNNKSRKAAGLDRHEKNTAASQSTGAVFLLFSCGEMCLSATSLTCVINYSSLSSTEFCQRAATANLPHPFFLPSCSSIFRKSSLAATRGKGGELSCERAGSERSCLYDLLRMSLRPSVRALSFHLFSEFNHESFIIHYSLA